MSKANMKQQKEKPDYTFSLVASDFYNPSAPFILEKPTLNNKQSQEFDSTKLTKLQYLVQEEINYHTKREFCNAENYITSFNLKTALKLTNILLYFPPYQIKAEADFFLLFH